MLGTLKNSKGLLGLNARNLQFIRTSNFKAGIRLADDKLKSKKLLIKAELPVADLFGTINTREELYKFNWDKLPGSFVIKPNRGLGGEGILVVYGRKKDGHWIISKQREITESDLAAHITNILDGNFSLANIPDIALIEERLKPITFLKPYSPKGVFDIRVIVYNRVPIMAMLRLPTTKTGGKANLAQGGIGVGIDIATGITTHALIKSWWWEKEIERTPETKLPLRGLRIPYWKEILSIAVRSQIISNLGFAGIDITLDKDKGPVILELNARPGLSIQNANLAPLRERLLRVSGLKITSSARGVKVAQNLFGGDIEQELEEISGRQVLGIVETVKLIGENKEEIELEAKVDTGADSTSVDQELGKRLGFEEVIKIFSEHQITTYVPERAKQELQKIKASLEAKRIENINTVIVHSGSGTTIRPVIPVTFTMAGEAVKTRASIALRQNLKYSMIVGRRDLKKFLVDPSKTIKLAQPAKAVHKKDKSLTKKKDA